MRYPIKISCSRGTPKKIIKKIRAKGLYETEYGVFSGVVTDRCLKKLVPLCKRYRLSLKINNNLGTRGTAYRRDFFKRYKPVHGKYYLCAYCGKKLTRQKSTVDHIIPVAKAAQSLKLQKMLFRMGIADINDPRNLVASCARCNKKKSDKMGLWIIRGFIGKNVFIRQLMTLFKNLIKLSLLAIFLYIIIVIYFRQPINIGI